jgi:hypothetical protein
MRLKEMQNRLFEAVYRRVRPHGYAHKANTRKFYKDTTLGRTELSLAIIKHAVEFDVAAHVAVRFDQLERLLNEFRNNLSEAEKVETFSLGGEELGNIAGIGYMKLGPVTGEQDIEPVADKILMAFEAVGLPYLEKYSNLEAALEAYAGDDRASRLTSPDGLRANRAIGLAYLLGRREKFFELAAAKTAFLSTRMENAVNISPQFVAQSSTDLESFLKVRDELTRRIESQDRSEGQRLCKQGLELRR